MYNLSTEQPLTGPIRVVGTTTSRRQESIGKKSNVCTKFIKLIRYEKVTCEICEFNVDQASDEEQFEYRLSRCRSFDCMKDVHPCDDYQCPKNIFYSGMKNLGHHENEMSKIARNCEWGIIYFFGPLVLDEIGDLYGLSRERIRQIIEDGLVKVGQRMTSTKELSHYIPDNGRKNLLELIDKNRERHSGKQWLK